MPIILTGPLTGQELLEIDPVSEDAANSVLQLGPGTSYELTAVAFPGPPLSVGYASSVDTEGEIPGWRRYGNREITFTTEFVDAGGGLLADFQEKMAKLQREGGTLRRTMKNGDVRIFDVVTADGLNPVYDVKYYLGDLTEVSVTLPARPLARGAEVDLGDNVETTLPVLVFTETGVAGDVPAIGRLLLDEDQGVDQLWATWAVQSRYYDSATSAALFFEAEGRTAMGGSAIAAGPTGASGAGSNVMRNTALATSFQAILSTQATGGGAHFSHIGTFRIWARTQIPTANQGTVSISLEWGDGDFRRYTRNATTDLLSEWRGTWRLVDLGLVTIPKVVAGTQRWEGRILAKSTIAGDDIDIDYLFLVPADEGSGEVAAVRRIPNPTAFSARDEFDQTAGALTGKTLPVGGTWVGAGDADDFQVSSNTAIRTAVSDTDAYTGRYATASTPTITGTMASVQVMASGLVFASAITSGLIARYTDANNWFAMRVDSATCHLAKRVAGTVTTIASTPLPSSFVSAILGGSTLELTCVVDASGWCAGWVNFPGVTRGAPLTSGWDSALATGGTLASGKVGFYDAQQNANATTRTYDNYWASSFVGDAAVFASQSLEIRNDRVVREDSGGTLWVTPSSYVGDYLTVPPAGAEGHTVRILVKMSRNKPGDGPDAGIDDVSARLFATPRYL